MISVEELLQPISESDPCGPDLSYDPGLQELETLARGKPETQFSAAELPDWKQVAETGLALFARAKDLRVALMLTVAWIELDGLPGFHRGLRLIAGMLQTFWATVHPQLDPADNNDPLQRLNIVASLAMPVGTFGDPYRVIERLRSAPLTSSVQMGRLTWADLLAADASGPSPTTGQTHTPAQIDAAFRDTAPAFLASNHEAVTAALELALSLDNYLTGIVGAGDAPDLSALTDELAALQKRLAPYVALHPAAAAGSSLPAEEGMAPSRGVPATLIITGSIGSRDEALRLLEKICDYYAQHEPSSPVPLILKRAARLARMDFMQILADLTPDSIAQVRNITGEPPQSPE